MGGIEAVGVIRKKEEVSGAHIPIIALTANAMKGDEENYLSRGMDGYLAKPIQLRKMDEILDRYVRLLSNEHAGNSIDERE